MESERAAVRARVMAQLRLDAEDQVGLRHFVLVPRRLLLLPLLVVLAAGCGGDGQGEAPPTGVSAAAEAVPTPAPQTGLVLSRFAEAAGARDVAEMWSLLSLESRKRLGPTVDDFSRELAAKFEEGLGTFAGTDYEIILAVEMPSGWGVAAIAGRRERGGEEEFASYAVALRRESDGWKVELGAPLDLLRVRPEDSQTSENRPEIAVGIKSQTPIEEAGIWLDGKPLPANAAGTDAGDVVFVGRPAGALSAGDHVVVAFGRSGELANAGSMPIEVNAPLPETGPEARGSTTGFGA